MFNSETRAFFIYRERPCGSEWLRDYIFIGESLYYGVVFDRQLDTSNRGKDRNEEGISEGKM